MLTPDLKDGFIILNRTFANRWWTGVECALARTRNGEAEQWSYLSHECRAELVNDDPFGHPGIYEYVAAKTWAGNLAMRAGPGLVGVGGPGEAEVDAGIAAHEWIDMPIEVTCAAREAKERSFDDVLGMLRSEFSGGHDKLHMAVGYRQGGHDYTLFTPCRYINFPDPGVERIYLQPISGLVLYEKDGRFHASYVVIYIEQGQVQALQFRTRHVQTHVFSEVERIDVSGATCRFFVYE